MKLADNAFDRNLISEKLFEALGSVVGVQSISLVGSFCDKQDLSVISDIDTIVVCDNLTEEIFESCIDSVSCLSGSELGFPDREIFVNSSFGPLKFDKPNLIVIHLMIYDTAGHREHVLKSPFTCYDWERSNLFHGKSLREVYPVLRLQPNHFTHARRGLDDYLEDISKGVISYRRYAFDSGVPQEVLDFHSLDSKHKGEYAYHIVKNLVSNYFKMLLGENIVFDQKELIFNWENFLPESVYFIPFYQKLEELKLNRASNYPEDTLLRVSGFLKCFEDSFARHWNSGLKIKFFRHGKTKLNGELAIQASGCKHIIIRTAWVFSEYGHNFLKTMLRLGADRDELSIVGDQIGCPTYAQDIARAIIATLPHLLLEKNRQGVYHYCGNEQCSWYDFAQVIFREASQLNHKIPDSVKPINTVDYPTLAVRPPYSVLNCSKIKSHYGIKNSDWRLGVKKVVKKVILI